MQIQDADTKLEPVMICFTAPPRHKAARSCAANSFGHLLYKWNTRGEELQVCVVSGFAVPLRPTSIPSAEATAPGDAQRAGLCAVLLMTSKKGIRTKVPT